MAYVLADNIISPLGNSSEENYLSVKNGKVAVHACQSSKWEMADDFEQLALSSASKALEKSGIDVRQSRIVFILSSTKGDVENMTPLVDSAQRIASALGIDTLPFVVCNACISGLSALILASRLLELDKYDYAVVCGCDVPKRFIVSGFQSLKALSSEPCRPFDMERFGLNLGQAAATMILGKEPRVWQLRSGYVKNDAFHISAPSKTAVGLVNALKETLQEVNVDKLALVNAHGTATLFNDQMESIAIERAGLSAVPVNALKGYYGHTLGAAGILETILTMKAIDDHTILGTHGFEELGVSGKIQVSSESHDTDKHAFIKMLSGFGGCNATLYATNSSDDAYKHTSTSCKGFQKKHLVKITPQGAFVNGSKLALAANGEGILTSIYKQYIGNYPKYYKMDHLCRLGFVASELLLEAENPHHLESMEQQGRLDRAVVLFNHSSSVDADKKFRATIGDGEESFPSPSIFVYTLPNIVTGEIAIRNHYQGETSFYILPEYQEMQMEEVLESSFMDAQTESILTGWVDYEDGEHFEAELYIAERIK